MICPECLGDKSVICSTDKGLPINAILRRRQCKSCGHLWSTLEMELDPLTVDAVYAVCELAAKLAEAKEVASGGAEYSAG